MTEQEYINRPSNKFLSKGIVYDLSEHSAYNPLTKNVTIQVPGVGAFPMSLSLVDKFLSIEENPEYFL